jgi:hypothetical protein
MRFWKKSFFDKYPAIWQSDTTVNSAFLLEEFEDALSSKLRQVISENNNWTGITVFARNSENYLSDLPCLSSFLEQFGFENILGATYFNLASHSTLHRHRDMNGNLLFGVMRLHIPLQTNPNAILEVKKKSYQLPVNTLWVLDTSGLHALSNTGNQNRIHLVLDVKYGSLTAKYFPSFSPAVALHLVGFILIMALKILRDALIRPTTLLNRIKSKIQQYVKR